ncbi:hypothetical protein CathTA2_0754 [Caldalkalibacillus thermarum TA2.A1]|uniref:Uncharacterized protein n=1 Tax=Caldalkalibacillus thermarum (strain TA2.A1) TaxID=986075 RepID=F5L4P1_CALTT|nr:hypothetical protein [Caldalkalibacillus thermarum]EGL83707.1 hypothetical protein CathTA2_0754 [Caldalkalibacillus thermarum TA2.A1]QZT33954.1 hypothetical protein HUR95_00490 [Caldalkalibacillus thermarum TA2.A1]
MNGPKISGQDLINAVMVADAELLKLCYVTLTKMSMWRMFASKVGQTADRILRRTEVNRYQNYLKKEVRELNMPLDQLRLKLLLTLAEKLNVPMNHLDTYKGLVELGEKLLDHAVKAYKAVDKKFTGHSFDHYVRYQLEKMFEVIGQQFRQASEKQREAFARQVSAFIEQMPVEQQEMIRKKLKLEDLSAQTVSRVLMISGNWAALYGLVSSMGFAFYTTASSLLAASAGLFGLTLPFGAYTFMSSIIAVVASPVFLAFMLPALGIYVGIQKKKLIRLFSPLVLMQLCLSYFSYDSSKVPSLDALFNWWNGIARKYQNLSTEIREFEKQLEDIQQEIAEKQMFRNEILQDIEINKHLRARVKEDIKQKIKTTNRNLLPKILLSAPLYKRYVSIKLDIGRLKRKRVSGEGVLEWLKAQGQKLHREYLRHSKEKEMEQTLDALADLVLKKKIAIAQEEQERWAQTLESERELERELDSVQQEIQNLEKRANEVKSRLDTLKQEHKRLDNDYYGLSQLFK